jgi:predicted DNA-binding transcriptional regulator YafY
MSNAAVICGAIQSRRLVRFYYDDPAPGIRVVEPHMIAYNRKDNLALSAWFLGGQSASQEGQGWREYLLDRISQLVVLEDCFPGPRPGYKRDGGKTFHNVQCAV